MIKIVFPMVSTDTNSYDGVHCIFLTNICIWHLWELYIAEGKSLSELSTGLQNIQRNYPQLNNDAISYALSFALENTKLIEKQMKRYYTNCINSIDR